MTNYIEEMMKTAGVEPDAICKYASGNIVYPTFTPEKQLEIFQLIQQTDFIDYIQCFIYEPQKLYVLRAFTVNELSSQNSLVYEGRKQNFAQALAQLTTELMSAGELDKEKVKEILG